MKMVWRRQSRDLLRDTAIMQREIMSAGIRMVAVGKVRWKPIWEIGLT